MNKGDNDQLKSTIMGFKVKAGNRKSEKILPLQPSKAEKSGGHGIDRKK